MDPGPGAGRHPPGRELLARLNRLRRRIRAWRRIRFTAAGVVFTLGTFAVGFAAINTGNNLLYLLLGAMLGLVAVSGWMSEQTIRSLEIRRSSPRGTPVGQPVPVRYRVTNHKRFLPTLAVSIGETDLPDRAWFGRIPAGGAEEGTASSRFVRRGVYPLHSVTVSTTFPFGLFVKERDVALPGELVVWPRSDRALRPPRPAAGRRGVGVAATAGTAGVRGEYRGLREYRPGDDPRDIHWRSSARLEVPVVREYERDTSEILWICLDLASAPGERAEDAVEIAASLAAGAASDGRPFGLAAGDRTVPASAGPLQLEAVLDALARVDFHPRAPETRPPSTPASCVLVTAGIESRGAFADVFRAGAPADREER